MILKQKHFLLRTKYKIDSFKREKKNIHKNDNAKKHVHVVSIKAKIHPL